MLWECCDQSQLRILGVGPAPSGVLESNGGLVSFSKKWVCCDQSQLSFFGAEPDECVVEQLGRLSLKNKLFRFTRPLLVAVLIRHSPTAQRKIFLLDLLHLVHRNVVDRVYSTLR